MCILCYGLTGEEHWTDARVGSEAPASARARRSGLLVTIMAAGGLSYSDDPSGVTAMLSNRKGGIRVVRGMGETWAAAEELAGHPLDPLDGDLLARLPGAA